MKFGHQIWGLDVKEGIWCHMLLMNAFPHLARLLVRAIVTRIQFVVSDISEL